jgi:hypothetical protein
VASAQGLSEARRRLSPRAARAQGGRHAPPAYRLLDLYFADSDAASVAVTTEAAGAFFGEVFARATGRVRIVFAEAVPVGVSA